MKRILYFASRTISDPAFLALALFAVLKAVFGGWIEALAALLCTAILVLDRAWLTSGTESYFLSAARTAYGDAGLSRFGKLPGSAAKAVSFLARASALLLALCVPFIAWGLGGGMNIGDVLSGLLCVAAVCTAAVSPTLKAFFGSVLSSRLNRLSSRDGGEGPLVTDPEAVEPLARADALMILDPSLIYDVTAEVRSVWASGTLYSGMSLAESALHGSAESALVMTAVSAARPGKGGSTHDDAMLRFCTVQLGDNPRLFTNSSFSRPAFDTPSPGDVAVTIKYSGGRIESETRLRSSSRGAVSACGYMRTHSGGTAEFRKEQLESALDAFDSMTQAGLTPYVFVSSPSVQSGEDSRVHPRGRILECILAVGGAFPEDNAAACSALSDFGVEPLLIIPSDSPSAARFARESGISDLSTGDADFCRPEELTANGGISGAELEKKHIFRGFSREDCARLIRRLGRDGRETAAVIKRQSDLSLLTSATAALGVAGSADAETARSLTAFVRPASASAGPGGLPAVFSLITESYSALCRMNSLFRTLCAFGVMTALTVVFSAVTGNPSLSPSAPALILAAEAVMRVSSGTLIRDRMIPREKETGEKGIARALIGSAGSGLLTAAAVELCAFLFFRDDPFSCLAFMTPACVFSGLAFCAAERLRVRRTRGITGFNIFFAAACVLSVLLCAALLAIPAPGWLSAVFGSCQNPLTALAAALIPAAVPFFYLGAGILIGKQTERARED